VCHQNARDKAPKTVSHSVEAIRPADDAHRKMRLAFGRQPPYLVLVRRNMNDLPRNRQGAINVESNSPSREQPQQNCLGDLRIGGYDRINAQRYVEQGELLADLALRASRGMRALMERVVKAARGAFAHKRDYAKSRIVHVD
jgi:hypothetical protein